MKKRSWVWLMAIIIVFTLSGCIPRCNDPDLSGREFPLSPDCEVGIENISNHKLAVFAIIRDSYMDIIFVEKLAVYDWENGETHTAIRLGDNQIVQNNINRSVYDRIYKKATLIVPSGNGDDIRWERWLKENDFLIQELKPGRVLPPPPLSPEKEETEKEGA